MGAVFKTPRNINKKVRFCLNVQLARFAMQEPTIVDTVKHRIIKEGRSPEFLINLAEYLEIAIPCRMERRMREAYSGGIVEQERGDALLTMVKIATMWAEWEVVADEVVKSYREREAVA